MTDTNIDALDLSPHWSLDAHITYLNHGAFGAVPRRVQLHQRALLDQIEQNPLRFFASTFQKKLDHARAEFADFLGTSPPHLAFLTNTTEGINAVLRSIDFEDGDEILLTDHTYPACLNACRHIADQRNLTLRIVELPLPIDEPQQVTQAIIDAVTDATRLALVDHITAFTAIRLPIDAIIDALHQRGVLTLIDGAHGPGNIDLHLDDLDPTFYVGNAHKWLCAPRGSAFLRVTDDHLHRVRPLAISNGASRPAGERSPFHLQFDWTGTADRTPWLSIPEVLSFLPSLLPGGWPAIYRRNHALALKARRRLLDRFPSTPLCPESMVTSAVAVDLPITDRPLPNPPFDPDPLQLRLAADHGIDVPIFCPLTPKRRLLRVSTHLYNGPQDLDRLLDALVQELDP